MTRSVSGYHRLCEMEGNKMRFKNFGMKIVKPLAVKTTKTAHFKINHYIIASENKIPFAM